MSKTGEVEAMVAEVFWTNLQTAVENGFAYAVFAYAVIV